MNLNFHFFFSNSDLTMKIWDFREMKEISTLEGFDEPTMSACWNHSGSLLLHATKDGFARIFDPRKGSQSGTVRN